MFNCVGHNLIVVIIVHNIIVIVIIRAVDSAKTKKNPIKFVVSIGWFGKTYLSIQFNTKFMFNIVPVWTL